VRLAFVAAAHLKKETGIVGLFISVAVFPFQYWFDGVCGLCNGFVDFLLRHDRHGVIRFASLQSAVGQKLLRRHGLPPRYVESIVFVSDGRAHHHSVAVLEALFRLSAPWTFFYTLMLIPPRCAT
jgi:predicted DCC family thiol-disulfide oxidoreductase YuxK